MKKKTEWKILLSKMNKMTALLKKMGFKRGAYKSDWERGKGDMHLKAPMKVGAEDIPSLGRRDAYWQSIVVDRKTGKVRIYGDDKLVDPDPESVAKLVLDAIRVDMDNDVKTAKEEMSKWNKVAESLKSCMTEFEELQKGLEK